MKAFRRTDRVASLLKETLSELLLFSVRDPRVQGVVVTRVHVTADLALCRVYVRTLREGAARAEVMDGLRACAGFLRHEVDARVRLLRTPRLEFFHDDLPEQVAAVEALIEKVRREDGSS